MVSPPSLLLESYFSRQERFLTTRPWPCLHFILKEIQASERKVTLQERDRRAGMVLFRPSKNTPSKTLSSCGVGPGEAAGSGQALRCSGKERKGAYLITSPLGGAFPYPLPPSALQELSEIRGPTWKSKTLGKENDEHSHSGSVF